MGLFVFLGLVVLTTLGVLILVGTDLLTAGDDRGSVEQVADPTVDEAPEIIAEEETADEESDAEEAAPLPPDDPTMSLTVPKLGIFDALVLDDVSEEGGLAAGVGHLPGTGFPWERGSNTFLAGHRLGYPGTASDHIFFNLHLLEEGDEIFLTDTNGQVYKYEVSEALQVFPTQMEVADPVEGRDMVSLQTCLEDFDDFETLGPNWNVRLIVRADRVA